MITEGRKLAFFQNLRRVSGYHEICNLAASAAEAFNDGDAERLKSFFAFGDPDLWIEFADEGRFPGDEAVEALLRILPNIAAPKVERAELFLTTPVIEIAGDGETAQGVWWCPVPMSIAGLDGTLQAIWAWGSIAADFLLMDTGWKIRHLHYFRVFKCRYEDGWVDDLSMINRLNLPAHPLSQPTTYHNPYSPLSIRDGIPAAPRPYAWYIDSSWMTETRKDR